MDTVRFDSLQEGDLFVSDDLKKHEYELLQLRNGVGVRFSRACNSDRGLQLLKGGLYRPRPDAKVVKISCFCEN